jgi:hypothetical protein
MMEAPNGQQPLRFAVVREHEKVCFTCHEVHRYTTAGTSGAESSCRPDSIRGIFTRREGKRIGLKAVGCMNTVLRSIWNTGPAPRNFSISFQGRSNHGLWRNWMSFDGVGHQPPGVRHGLGGGRENRALAFGS